VNTTHYLNRKLPIDSQRCITSGNGDLSSTVGLHHVRLWARLGRSRLATSVAEDSVTVTVVTFAAGAGSVAPVPSTVLVWKG
jgi:hypothetical protein